MPLPIPTVSLLEGGSPWLVMIVLGAFHGLNPGMGWLFALSLGLQQHSGRVIWISLFPIAIGHAASITVMVLVVLAGLRVMSLHGLQLITAVLLLGFGVYKLFNYYRHPRWVGMKVGMRDLLLWSFLMATAHGAGLMVIPALLGVAAGQHSHHFSGHLASVEAGAMLLAVCVHTLSMLLVMGAVAWIVYRKMGLSVLRRNWINFDLIWAVALLVVGGVALLIAI